MRHHDGKRWCATLCLAGMAFSATAQWHTTAEVQALYAAAREEGEVVVWGTAAREVQWIPQAFNAIFPGIQVKVLGDNTITTKAIAEARAGRHTVDVMVASLSQLIQINQRDMLQTIDWSLFDVPPGNVALDGRVGYTHNIVYTIAYNKHLVQARNVPTRWEQLLDPQYKGKMVANQFLLPRLVGTFALVWGEDRTTQFARDLRAQADVMLTNTPREPFLQSGERLYAVGEIDTFPRLWARDGIAVDYVIPEPVITAQFGVMVVKNAPHFAAARLMAGWMASPEGKRTREEAALQSDYLPTSKNPVAQRIYASGAQVLLDTPELSARRDAVIRQIAPIVLGQAR